MDASLPGSIPEEETDLPLRLEALLFAGDEPLSVELLAKFTEWDKAAIRRGLEVLSARLEEGSALRLVEIAGGWRLETKSDYFEDIKEMFNHRKTSRLSMAALESLALIAYKQPVTAIEIAEMRMVTSVSSILKNLMEKRLIRMAGRKKVIGRPMMYATTKDFLLHFGLNQLKDLPSLEEFRASFATESAVAETEHDQELPLELGDDSFEEGDA